jgi:hypothetical protein
MQRKAMTNPASTPSIEVSMAFEGLFLDGRLIVPEHAKGLVVFAHGSGSSRFSSRNRFVAEILNEAGIPTLLFKRRIRNYAGASSNGKTMLRKRRWPCCISNSNRPNHYQNKNSLMQ